VHEHPARPRDARTKWRYLDALVDVVVRKYGPLPAASLSRLVWRLRYAVPQWTGDLDNALRRAKRRLAHGRVEGVDWYFHDDGTQAPEPDDRVRLLAPFDQVAWDRRRSEILWGWA